MREDERGRRRGLKRYAGYAYGIVIESLAVVLLALAALGLMLLVKAVAG